MADTTTETVHLDTPGGPMGAYVAAPEARPRGGVVVVQEAFGLTDHIRDVTRRVAAAGYLAVAPALFHRTGSPVLAYGDFDAVRPHMDALRKNAIVADLDAAFGYLREQGVPVSGQGIVGFCMGGTVATFAASAFAIGAAVSFYGGGVSQDRFGFGPLADLASGFTTPWLGIYGGADQSIPPEDVDRIRTEASKAGVDSDVIVYDGAQHGFHCDDRPQAYAPEAAKDAWGRTLAFLEAHLRR
jgi:carboxymethylenebutenolidase